VRGAAKGRASGADAPGGRVQLATIYFNIEFILLNTIYFIYIYFIEYFKRKNKRHVLNRCHVMESHGMKFSKCDFLKLAVSQCIQFIVPTRWTL
jgi:hypothetical protein